MPPAQNAGAPPAEVRRFLAHAVDPAEFHHADHVQVAFEILRRHPFPETVALYCAALRTIAANAGRPQSYHETITVAFLALIAERMTAAGDRDFAEFARANADLFEKLAVSNRYSAERLRSDAARLTFLLPDRCQ